MSEQQVDYTVQLQDPASGQMVDIRFTGRAVRQGGPADGSADGHVVQALYESTGWIVTQALGANQVALPTLGHSLAHFTPQIVQAANEKLAPVGVALGHLDLQCQVPQSSITPAAAAIAAAPSPMESVASSFAGNVADEVASSVPNRLNVKVGGYNVGIGGDGVDGGSLADQAADKVKSNLIHYAIVGGVLLFVSFICCGAVAFKLLF